MKKILRVKVLIAACMAITLGPSAFAGVADDVPVVLSKPIAYKDWLKLKNASPQIEAFGDPAPEINSALLGEKKIVISSVCSSQSSYLVQSRLNVMAGL